MLGADIKAHRIKHAAQHRRHSACKWKNESSREPAPTALSLNLNLHSCCARRPVWERLAFVEAGLKCRARVAARVERAFVQAAKPVLPASVAVPDALRASLPDPLVHVAARDCTEETPM